MRLIDADKIEYYPVDRNGKHIGEMVWKPHIDGIETFNLEEHDKQIREDVIEEIIPKVIDLLINANVVSEKNRITDTNWLIEQLKEQENE